MKRTKFLEYLRKAQELQSKLFEAGIKQSVYVDDSKEIISFDIWIVMPDEKPNTH